MQLLSFNQYLLLQELNTPLHYAAIQGHNDICLLLLANGADISEVNKVSICILK